MKKIPLTQGKYALVDNNDYAFLSQWKWYANKGKNGNYYARRHLGKEKQISLQNALLKPPKGLIIDHINGNGLDNRRSNLRICTLSQNNFNRNFGERIKSGYRGVRWHKVARKWEAQISKNNKKIYIGLFDNIRSAAKAYQRKAKELFGEYAR